MPDREKVITALAICTGKCKCLGCWYGQNNPDFRCQDRLKEDVLTLPKEQPEIVRCKDCKNAVVYDDNEVICAHIDSNGNDKHSIDWFCGDGERR
jgi:hypothetical protein